MHHLKSLCLSDTNFADNPICSLCNYQTHVVYHLPDLKFLDTLEVTDESRKMIHATVIKKRMYYNMRIKTIKRNTNFLLKFMDEHFISCQMILSNDIREWMIQSKKIQKMLFDIEWNRQILKKQVVILHFFNE